MGNNGTSRIALLMKKKNITFEMLEKQTGIPHSALQRYSSGQTKKIPANRLWRIAWELNTTPDYLIGSTDDPNPSYIAKKVLIENSTKEMIAIIDMLQQLSVEDQNRVRDFILGLIAARQ